jgi:hypothetical protein
MSDNLTLARAHLLESTYTCVLKSDDRLLTSSERGVKPLLDWLDAGMDLGAFSAADRVVGNGAAFLYVLLGVKEIYAHVLSRTALQTLEQHQIPVTYGTLVDAIQNRQKTENCPIEEAVKGETDPTAALVKIRARLAELKK